MSDFIKLTFVKSGEKFVLRKSAIQLVTEADGGTNSSVYWIGGPSHTMQGEYVDQRVNAILKELDA